MGPEATRHTKVDGRVKAVHRQVYANTTRHCVSLVLFLSVCLSICLSVCLAVYSLSLSLSLSVTTHTRTQLIYNYEHLKSLQNLLLRKVNGGLSYERVSSNISHVRSNIRR